MKTLERFAGTSHRFSIPNYLSPEEEEVFVREAGRINELIENEDFYLKGEALLEVADGIGVSETVIKALGHLIGLAGIESYIARDLNKWLIGMNISIRTS